MCQNPCSSSGSSVGGSVASPGGLASTAFCTHCHSIGGGLLLIFPPGTRFRAVVLLLCFPHSHPFAENALGQTIHDFKNPFSVCVLLDPLFPSFFGRRGYHRFAEVADAARFAEQARKERSQRECFEEEANRTALRKCLPIRSAIAHGGTY